MVMCQMRTKWWLAQSSGGRSAWNMSVTCAEGAPRLAHQRQPNEPTNSQLQADSSIVSSRTTSICVVRACAAALVARWRTDASPGDLRVRIIVVPRALSLSFVCCLVCWLDSHPKCAQALFNIVLASRVVHRIAEHQVRRPMYRGSRYAKVSH